MRNGALWLASIGLAVNVVLWGVPGLVMASGAAHLLLPGDIPSLSDELARVEASTGSADRSPTLLDALVQLIGAEAAALQVAGTGLQQPPPQDLTPRANAAGDRVRAAAADYLQVFQHLTAR